MEAEQAVPPKKKRIRAVIKIVCLVVCLLAFRSCCAWWGNMGALNRAVGHGRLARVKFYLLMGADIHGRYAFARTPLHCVAARAHAREEHLKIAEYLLEQGANPNLQDSDGMTPLHWAIRASNPQVARLLLSRGADPNIQNKGDDTPFAMALRLKQYGLFEVFLAHGASPNPVANRLPGYALSRAPLALAVENETIVSTLLAKGADPTEGAVLRAAVRTGESSAVVLVLEPALKRYGEKYADVVPLPPHGLDTHLLVGTLLSEGYNERITRAIEEGDAGLAGFLYHCGFAPEGTPLQRAVRGKAGDLLELLLAHGADPNVHDQCGNTPLHLAVAAKALLMLENLLDAGASIDAKDGQGRTALHWAAISQIVAIVNVLLDAGADPNAQDCDGNTPLHYVACLDTDIAKTVRTMLLESGADAGIKNSFGQPPGPKPKRACTQPRRVKKVTPRVLSKSHDAETNAA